MKTVFIAGGSGLVGLRMIPQLVEEGWRVVATTRSSGNMRRLRMLGSEPVLVDCLDPEATMAAVQSAKPDVIIHQLTSLPDRLEPSLMPEALPKNAEIRDAGTRNLCRAAVAAGVKRFVAQSIAFAYKPGVAPLAEGHELDPKAWGVISLESQVTGGDFTGLVLRYGYFYGPDTGFDEPKAPGSIHVQEAARAACLAAGVGPAGIYNIAEDDGSLNVGKAERLLGFRARKAGGIL